MTQDTRERLLRAAVAEFSAQGYRGATVRRILERAGERNQSAIAYHFGGKEQLYRAVLDFLFRDAERFVEGACAGPAEPADARGRLEAMIRFLCRAYYTIQTGLDRDLYRLFVREAGNPGVHFREMMARHLRPGRERLCALLRDHLGPGVPDRVIDDCEYSISAQILHGALGWSIISATQPERAPFTEDVERLADHVVRFSLAGLEAFRRSEPR